MFKHGLDAASCRGTSGLPVLARSETPGTQRCPRGQPRVRGRSFTNGEGRKKHKGRGARAPPPAEDAAGPPPARSGRRRSGMAAELGAGSDSPRRHGARRAERPPPPRAPRPAAAPVPHSPQGRSGSQGLAGRRPGGRRTPLLPRHGTAPSSLTFTELPAAILARWEGRRGRATRGLLR